MTKWCSCAHTSRCMPPESQDDLRGGTPGPFQKDRLRSNFIRLRHGEFIKMNDLFKLFLVPIATPNHGQDEVNIDVSKFHGVKQKQIIFPNLFDKSWVEADTKLTYSLDQGERLTDSSCPSSARLVWTSTTWTPAPLDKFVLILVKHYSITRMKITVLVETCQGGIIVFYQV